MARVEISVVVRSAHTMDEISVASEGAHTTETYFFKDEKKTK
jgi:hypothetical protein